jgi:nitroimidazol reductase NimA-like FMN-containing flavoprotein (pyridoxamine 5'-phosphate oxidase superfamily)
MNANSHGAQHEPDGGPAHIPFDDDDQTSQLTHVQCWDLLGETGVGHLALRAQPHGVDIMPINYLIHNRELYFRSAPGTKLEELALHPHVAVQVEQRQDGRWSSVVLKGVAKRLAFDDEILASGVTRLVTSGPGEKANYVRVVPDAITGRSFPAL